ncbi:hypothetical protein QZH41_001850 [Actinostola sp. cb2023]|nr:hypothetical protein QZH41_001850 [Actinostola sp. cb2023]
MLICTCVWAVGLVSSIVPMFGLNYFIDKEDEEDFGFYGRSSVCLPLQLSSDLPAGWEYSVVFFLAINFAAFVFMLVAYIAIFSKVKRSANAVRSTAINRESSLAKKVIFIILTDFLCWMPVIVIGILSLTGNFNDPTKQVYVWIAVFVLPINSSINPFLYTFATVQSRKKPKKKTSSQERHDAMDVHVHTSKEKGNKELEKVKYKIQLLEELDIKKLNDGVGFALAQVEASGFHECCLVKYFSPDMKEVWKKELDLISRLMNKDNDKHGVESLVTYRWHCSANEHSTEEMHFNIPEIESSTLICYEYVPNNLLVDFLKDKEAMTFKILCFLCIDIMAAIEYLQSRGISSNNINTRSIIVRESDSQANPFRAVLVDLSRANTLRIYDDGYYAKTDMIQFGRLFKIMLKCCNEFNEYEQVDDILSLCNQQRSQSTAEMIRTRLMEVQSTASEGMEGTYV